MTSQAANIDSWGVVAIGHSHLTALDFAHREKMASGDLDDGVRFSFIQLLEDRFRPPSISVDGVDVLNNNLAAAIFSNIEKSPGRLALVLSLSGNEYQFIGMFNNPRRFDFSLPEKPEIPIAEEVEIIPVTLLEQRFRGHARHALALIPVLSEAMGAAIPVYCIESPPPIPDNDFIKAGSSTFATEIRTYGVSPPWLRFKLWSLQSRIFREEAALRGATYLSRPDEAVDELGFMRRDGWHGDGVHGTPWYGGLVLRQIERLLTKGRPRSTIQ